MEITALAAVKTNRHEGRPDIVLELRSYGQGGGKDRKQQSGEIAAPGGAFADNFPVPAVLERMNVCREKAVDDHAARERSKADARPMTANCCIDGGYEIFSRPGANRKPLALFATYASASAAGLCSKKGTRNRKAGRSCC